MHYMLMRIQKCQKLQIFSKLMCSNMLESQRVGERAYGSPAQPILAPLPTDFVGLS